METSESRKTAFSSRRPVGKPLEDEVRSPVLAEVHVDASASSRRPSVRAADELSDEEAEAFFFV